MTHQRMRLTACVSSAFFATTILVIIDSPRALALPGEVLAHQKLSSTQGGPICNLRDRDYWGNSVAGLGDVDGDGINDIAVGNYGDDDGNTGDGNWNSGAVRILFLNENGTTRACQKISATQGGFGGSLDRTDYFGWSLAAIGDLDTDGVPDLAVGAPLDDDGGFDFGAVWILFLNSNGTVKASQKISAAVGGAPGPLDTEDHFSHSLASLGDVDNDGVTDLAAGAWLDDDGGLDRGATYVLFMNRTGSVRAWQKISSTQGGFACPLRDRDYWATSVAGPGDIDNDGVPDMIVGGYGDDDGNTGDGNWNSGAVWTLFLNRNGTVRACQKISAQAGGFSGALDRTDYFGYSVAATGDLDGDGVRDITVGAMLDDDGGFDLGAVWTLFLNANGTVRAHQKISASSGGFNGSLDSEDHFGRSITSLGDLNGDYKVEIAVGAWHDDDGGTDLGATWILFVDGEPQCPRSPDCNTNAEGDACDIASGVSRDCNTNAIPDECDIAAWRLVDCNSNGTPDLCEVGFEDCNTNGTVDSCELAGSDCNTNGVLDACESLSLHRIYPTEGEIQDNYAGRLSMSAELLFVGATLDDNSNGANAGMVHVFRRVGTGWVLSTTIFAPDGQPGDFFGETAQAGETVLIGAPGDDDRGQDAGAVYVYRRAGLDTWTFLRKLYAGDPVAGDGFGEAMEVSGDTAVVAASMALGGTAVGKAYVLERGLGGAENWGQRVKLTAPDGEPQDSLGHTVAIDGDTIVLGAVHGDSPRGEDRGAAYVYERNAGGANLWGLVAKLTASDGNGGDAFSTGVAIHGHVIATGAPAHDNPLLNAGAVYLFVRPNTGWADATESLRLQPVGLQVGNGIGSRIALSRDWLVVPSQFDNDAGTAAGALYAYRRDVSDPLRLVNPKKIINPDAVPYQLFGGGVPVLLGHALAIGSNGPHAYPVPAYVFDLRAYPFDDCNANHTPDECELVGRDCDNNGTPDQCESEFEDCNTNGTADSCELAGNDCNTNGVLDACESLSRLTFTPLVPPQSGLGASQVITHAHVRNGMGGFGLAELDVNSDGFADVAVANRHDNSAGVLTNIHDRTFLASHYPLNGNFCVAIAAGALDDDSSADLVIVNRGDMPNNPNGTHLSLLYNDGSGGFGNMGSIELGERLSLSVDLGDFDADGKLDIVVALPESQRIAIIRNRGNRTYDPPLFLSNPPSSSWFIAAVDIDGDGKLDVVQTHETRNTVTVLWGRGGQIRSDMFDAPLEIQVGEAPIHATVADLDGDGRLDVAVANNAEVRSPSTIAVLWQGLVRTFTTSRVFLPHMELGGANGIASADFDNDGVRDMAVSTTGHSRVLMLRGLGSRAFAAPISFGVGATPYSIDSADFDRDGRPDLATPYDAFGGIYVLFNEFGATSNDCNTNLLPDECDIANGAADCNSNRIPDVCELSSLWTLRSTTGPGPRQLHGMAYDSARGVTVLFGGNDSAHLGDTWEWNGATWTLRATNGPSARSLFATAYDSIRGMTVVFGGYDPGFFGDTWGWNGSGWTLLHPADPTGVTAPTPRRGSAMALDSARGVIVLFGGSDGSINNETQRGDTWEWNGTSWMRRNPPNSPTARSGHAMAYDSGRGLVVLFGGAHPNGSLENDTWEWNGQDWNRRMVAGPDGRSEHAMAYDSARGVTVLFGGHDILSLGDTWEWVGVQWTARLDAGCTRRNGPAMAFDSARGKTVLFGGHSATDNVYHGDTWEYGRGRDCNSNSIPDECEYGMGGGDCNSNGTPDICEPGFADCNTNALPDLCEIIGGQSADCNSNGTPDACDLVGPFERDSGQLSPFADPDNARSFTLANAPVAVGPVTLAFTARADLNGDKEFVAVFVNDAPVGAIFMGAHQCPTVPDADQIVLTAAQFNALRAAGGGTVTIDMNGSHDVSVDCNPSWIRVVVRYNVVIDCNTNGVPDPCEPDCDTNGTPDSCQGAVADCNTNGVPDQCDLINPQIGDCNTNATPDDCDIRNGAADCNTNRRLDICETAGGAGDCNTDRIPDACQLVGNDCNSNGTPDACDIARGTSGDCDGNRTPDECEAFGADCNTNGTRDVCDISGGGSADCNSNRVPDVCEMTGGAVYESGQMSPFGGLTSAERTRTFSVPNAPLAIGPVTITIMTVSDLDEQSEYVDVFLNPNPTRIARFFQDDGHLCPFAPELPDAGVIVLSAAAFNEQRNANGGTAAVRCVGSLEVNVNCEPSWISVRIEYMAIAFDCNTNGTLDSCEPDCNSNGVPDACDGTVCDDCNTNGIPDPQELPGRDCNTNGRLDVCDVAAPGGSRDCNSNRVPDECDVPPIGTFADCNTNRTPDACEDTPLTDCNTNNTLDACERNPASDCNTNGTLDACDIRDGRSGDCNTNRVPDECDLPASDCNSNGTRDECDVPPVGMLPDCNTNRRPDSCELPGNDCNSNGVPDECDGDCDTNGTPDDCEPPLALRDCDTNGTDDRCELAGRDCNTSGTPDVCELVNNDCDGNGILDSCDIAAGRLGDCNSNGLPDCCEPYLVIGAVLPGFQARRFCPEPVCCRTPSFGTLAHISISSDGPTTTEPCDGTLCHRIFLGDQCATCTVHRIMPPAAGCRLDIPGCTPQSFGPVLAMPRSVLVDRAGAFAAGCAGNARGNQLIIGSGNVIRVVNSETGVVCNTIALATGTIEQIALDLLGRLYVGTDGDQVYRINSAGIPTLFYACVGGAPRAVAIGREGGVEVVYVVCASDGVLRKLRTDGTVISGNVAGGLQGATAIAVAPAGPWGERLVIARPGGIELLNRDGGDRETLLTQTAYGLAFDPNGVLHATQDQHVLRIRANPPRGDVNGDGEVDALDVGGFTAALLRDPVAPLPLNVADMNCDGCVDGADIELFVADVLGGGVHEACGY